MRKLLLATSALVPLGLASAFANPQGAQVVGGSASVNGVGTTTVTVKQSSQNAVINWTSFNIGSGEKTLFIQPNSNATILNRVTGDPNPSQIFGTLTANGRVFIVNPNGVLIGNGAVINTAGFLATTHDIGNGDFIAGRYNFNISGRPDASIVNMGSITASNAGFAALVAPGVRNSGTISATFGKIGLASANGFSLDLYGDKLIGLGVSDSIAGAVKDAATGATLKSLVRNDGTLKANGGVVQLTAAAARQVVDAVINTTGVVEARSIGRREGKIVLGGPASATKAAGAPTQTVKVSGQLTVASKKAKGGTIEVTGENIELASAKIDASGRAGGGKVLIGGDTGGGNPGPLATSMPQAKLESQPVPNATTVTIDSASTIDVSAKSIGDGGKIVVWSDGGTVFNGNILARGGATAGNGGFAEVSGKQMLTYNGWVDLGAVAGKAGMLLLDPLNGKIDNVAGPGVITVGSIQNALLTSDVKVATGTIGNDAGDLTVAAPIAWATENNLWLSAFRNVVLNANITNSFAGIPSSPDKHQVFVQADNTGKGVGAVMFTPGVKISTSSEVNIVYNPDFNPAKYSNPTDYSALGDGGAIVKGYMLVNTPTDLQSVTNNLSANYVLGRNIDLNGVSFVPIGNGAAYTGRFFGQSNSISNLSITSAASQIGLFSALGSGAEVGHLVLKNFSMTGTLGSSSKIGALAGESTSGNVDIRDVNVIQSSVAVKGSGSDAGLLIGYNSGKIFDSHASGAVTIDGGLSTIQAGGLVGYNSSGTSPAEINRSFSTASVTSNATGASVEVGGVVGHNDGQMADVYGRGAVTGATSNYAGGLAGINGASGAIDTGYAANAVTGTAGNVGALVGKNDSPGGAFANLYWDSGVNPLAGVGTGVATGTTGLSTASMTSPNMPSGFGSPPWTFDFGLVPNYPHFTYEKPGNTFVNNYVVLYPPAGTPSVPGYLLQTPVLLNIAPLRDLSGPLPIRIAIGDPPASPLGSNPSVGGTNAGGPRTFVPPPLSPRPVAGPGGERFSSVPPAFETRFFPNEVVVQVPANISPEMIAQLARELGLSVIATQNLASLGRTAIRFRITNNRTVRDIIRALELRSIVAIAQPNHRFRLTQPAAAASKGDPAQYMLSKLQLEQAHKLASGRGITIAVIDSEVDKKHTEFQGSIAEQLDTLGAKEQPHSHGTAMVGAIVSRDRLLGVAPDAKILAVRAFGEVNNTAEGTTFNILKGIEWSVSQGARVINMSFAGPRDPSLERAINAAREKGVVLVAAAGNAGPKSPPLYPGADPNVIAVTATDVRDGVFRGANQGAQVSVAAPGVEILAPAPDESYQMSTGTSIATAHVSGVAALMLERDPTLKPHEVRKILESTATDLGPRGKDSQYGWGLINPQRALEAVSARRKTSDAAPKVR